MLLEKKRFLDVDYTIVNYKAATEEIIKNAKLKNSYGVSALAVHGLIESVKNPYLNKVLSNIHMITPDGQPIRWALNSLYNTKLIDRVYGPKLTEFVLEEASQLELNVFLYGSTKKTLNLLSQNIKLKYPGVNICGIHIDRFRDATAKEDLEDIQKINRSGANIVLVGRGCPRQEIWVGEHLGKVNAVMMAVGAAFDFIAGTKKQAPRWMQDNGLEWFYRLMQEPKRLFRRYFTTNTIFIFLFLKEKLITQFK